MKILISFRQVRPGKGGGIAIYAKELVETLARDFPEIELHLLETFYNHNHYCDIDKARCTRHLLTKPDRYDDQIIDAINEISPDVVFYPLPGDPIVKREGTKFVVCIADLQHKTYPDNFSQADILARDRAYTEVASLADKIITLSEHAKSDILSAYNLTGTDVVVVSPALAGEICKSTEEGDKQYLSDRYGLPQDYIFYPANFWKHKNHKNLFHALRLLIDSGHETNLVLTGALFDERTDLQILLQELKIEDRVKILGYIPKSDLETIFKNAKLMVFPSLFEGFGIPLVESFAFEVPVCCSDATSLPEVAGDAAVLFDATKPESISSAISSILSDSSLADVLVDKGTKQCAKFNYKLSTKVLFEIFADLVNTMKPPFPIITSGPAVSIITPSFNQGCFIESTIKSVLNQSYTNIEYIVCDGKSTDNTTSILEKYADKLFFVSEPDEGQTDAINKGIARSEGEFVCYLNSDDTLEPNAISLMVSYLLANPQVDVVYGNADYIDKKSKFISPYTIFEWDFEKFKGHCFICQPATMWRCSTIEKWGGFDSNLNFIMDYEYWLRIAANGGVIGYLPIRLANSRLYSETKTKSGREFIYKEIFQVTNKMFGTTSRQWVCEYWHYLFEEKYRIPGLALIYRLFLKKFITMLIFRGHEEYENTYNRPKISVFCKNCIYVILRKIFSLFPRNLAQYFRKTFSNKGVKEVFGVYSDGWVSPNLRVNYNKEKPLTKLLLDGEIAEAGTMKITIDQSEFSKSFNKGPFAISIDIDTPSVSQISIFCSYSKVVGKRDLSYLLHYTNLFSDLEIEWNSLP